MTYTEEQIIGIRGHWTGFRTGIPSRFWPKHKDLVEKFKAGLLTLAEVEKIADDRWYSYCRNR